ncbi:MAG TPA: hypothetical protein VJJ24_02705 [Candidatus Paceibacterota bacterium]
MELETWFKAADVESLAEARKFLADVSPSEGHERYLFEVWTNFYKQEDYNKALRTTDLGPSLLRNHLFNIARLVRGLKHAREVFQAPRAVLLSSVGMKNEKTYQLTSLFTFIGGSNLRIADISLEEEDDCPRAFGRWAEIEFASGLYWLRVTQSVVPVHCNQGRLLENLWHPLFGGELVRVGMVNLTFEVEEDPGVIGVPVQLGLDL